MKNPSRCNDSLQSDQSLGMQLLVDLYDCDRSILDDVARVESALTQAAGEAGVTVLRTVLHRFSPYGVSGAVIIAESHITIHTWPEHGYAALDVFTCRTMLDADRIVAALGRAFGALRSESRLLDRGILS